ncbi:hypothetical protein [Marinitoga lauensis]|nr:hypothetical protein [Marinitoga lauensis]
MKKSKYTIYKKIDDKIILFNTLYHSPEFDTIIINKILKSRIIQKNSYC